MDQGIRNEKSFLNKMYDNGNQALITENYKDGIQEICEDFFHKLIDPECIRREMFTGFQHSKAVNEIIMDKNKLENCRFSEKDAGSDQEPIYFTISGYRALYKKKQKARRSSRSTIINIKELKNVEKSNEEKYIKTLKKNILLQMSTLNQVNKAISYCYSSSNQNFLPQVAECERLLLLSSYRYYEMTKKLRFLKGNKKNNICPVRCESGTVRISKLFLYFNNLASQQKDRTEKWYICVVSCKENIEGSRVHLVPKNESMLRIDEDFTFKNLSNDFVIIIQIFSLESKRLRKQWKQRNRKMNCGRMISSDLLTPEDCKSCDFKLEGSFSLKLQDLKSAVLGEFARGSLIEFQLMWDVDSKVQLSGFLEIEKDVGEYKVWDRKWCLIEGCVLKYWNYPSDREYMPPLGILDLQHCITSKVQPVDKERNPWCRTFVLEMLDVVFPALDKAPTKQIQKRFFRADSSKELSDWCLVLNEHIGLLRNWKLSDIDDIVLS